MAKKVKYLVPDAEFSSFDMIGGDLLVYALVEVYEDLTIGRSKVWYFKPRGSKYFTEGARKIHGISYFKALEFPDPKESCISILQWLVPLQDQFQLKTAFYGSWNFDLKWLRACFEECGLTSSLNKAFSHTKEDHFNVLQAAKKKLKHIQEPLNTGKDKKEDKYSLSNVARFYNLEHNHHEALSDALVTAQVLINLEKGIDVWTGELF